MKNKIRNLTIKGFECYEDEIPASRFIPDIEKYLEKGTPIGSCEILIPMSSCSDFQFQLDDVKVVSEDAVDVVVSFISSVG